ncbi:glycosyltransferase family 4 protein [Frigoribacterium sp. ACAM 257]|uniref:glycosyltransferase n=1 Tax=Frigoribacterium sp. ACAM 257 TaxID=2508998 RepID=UPI0011BA1FA3|nr:glycosyltransferase [Frigoribacterium sp. ACAM 257]TWX40658.1 glycosyltransferase family 4 protein [Frigoribacterium sp. ACAM 257]
MTALPGTGAASSSSAFGEPARTAERPRRIVVVAPLRYPIAEPHAGGLESSVWHQVRVLRARGHEVLLCAVEGSDDLLGGPPEFALPAVHWDDPADATDSTYPDGYLEVAVPALHRALDWIRDHADQIDVVENHSLSGHVLSRAGELGVPVVSTLHTPTLPDLLAHHRAGGEPRSAFLAVSEHTAAAWRAEGVEARVLPNAVDTDLWPLGPGGDDLVWTGRIVPEKGPHLAIEAARLAGRRIVLAGRVGDVDYHESMVLPLLGADAEHVGPLRQPDLAELVGHSACALVTPCWDEPFGLVIAEALSAGTPVASFATGGVPEVVGSSIGAGLVARGDVVGLAHLAAGLADAASTTPGFRRRVRADALERFSLHRRAEVVEEVHEALVAGHLAGAGKAGAPLAPEAAA